MILAQNLIAIGKFQKTHALKGELNMISEIDPEFFLEGYPLIVNYDGILVPYFAESVRTKGSTSYLIKIEGVDTEEEASQFINKDIFIQKKDSYEWFGEEIQNSEDLIGYKLIDSETYNELGTIVNIDDSTSNILFIVASEEGEEIMLPANEELITEIDNDSKKIIMMIPDGLLDLNRKLQ